MKRPQTFLLHLSQIIQHQAALPPPHPLMVSLWSQPVRLCLTRWLSSIQSTTLIIGNPSTKIPIKFISSFMITGSIGLKSSSCNFMLLLTALTILLQPLRTILSSTTTLTTVRCLLNSNLLLHFTTLDTMGMPQAPWRLLFGWGGVWNCPTGDQQSLEGCVLRVIP